MLDRAKLGKEFERVASSYYAHQRPDYTAVRAAWQQIAHNETFAQHLAARDWSLAIPKWQGVLGACYTLKPITLPYAVFAVDGSQIYPDRHQGVSWYLINIGTVELVYGNVAGRALLNSEPYLFTDLASEELGVTSLIDLVNCKREAFEFDAGYQCAQKVVHLHDQMPYGVLFDGSLIFWHLAGYEQQLKDCFLARYMCALTNLSDTGAWYAAYVSAPRHKELSNIVRLFMSDFDEVQAACLRGFESLNDVVIASFFLLPYTRSTIFYYTGPLCALYPASILPAFFYLHNGYEYARVEIPSWIAHDGAMVNYIAQVLIDQTKKGSGYPVALAEAHEQAVVKGADRDFFYHLIAKTSIDHKQQLRPSLKSMKKRSLGV